ncbi:MAG: cytochrome P450 [Chloroflexi bacterium]|nr:cytochrome P450 [Chloroflexota bacterium]
MSTLLPDVEIPSYVADWCIVTSFWEAEEIVRSPAFHAGRMESESLPFRGDSIIELDGDEHTPRRRLEGQLFARSALRHYETEVLDRAIERCLADLARNRDPDGVVRANLVDLSRVILLQIAASLIGLDDVDTEARTRLLAECFAPLDAGVVVKWSARNHATVIHEGLLAKEQFRREFLDRSLARRRQLVSAHRSGQLAREALPRDLLTLMLLHPSDEWDEDLVVREAILYLAASIGTSSTATTFAVSELDSWLREHPADRSKLQDTAFLRRVANEVLRLRATFPAIMRRAVRDVTLRNGRRFAAGDRIAIINDAVNRDRSVFGDDAGCFNPCRVVPHGVFDYGLAFGSGQKSCIGKALVTTAQESADAELDRTMVKQLKAFYRAGIVVDPTVAPERAPTAEVRYTVFPVRFDRL